MLLRENSGAKATIFRRMQLSWAMLLILADRSQLIIDTAEQFDGQTEGGYESLPAVNRKCVAISN